jgi:hypothetical protein
LFAHHHAGFLFCALKSSSLYVEKLISAPEIIDSGLAPQFFKETLNRTSGTDFAIDFFGDCVCQREIAAQSHSRMCIAVDAWSLLSIPGRLGFLTSNLPLPLREPLRLPDRGSQIANVVDYGIPTARLRPAEW